MQVHYLEIVTKDVDAVCATYAQLHGERSAAVVPGANGEQRPPIEQRLTPPRDRIQLTRGFPAAYWPPAGPGRHSESSA